MNKVQKKMVKDPGLKKDILANGWKLLSEQGRQALQLRELARLSDCSIGTVYNHYKNLDEIILRLNMKSLDQMYHILHQTMTKAIASGDDLHTTFEKTGRAYITFGLKHPKLWRSVFENMPMDPLPDWYRQGALKGLTTIEELTEQTFKLPQNKAKQLVTFWEAAMHGITSILLNRKREALDTPTAEKFITSYIRSCLRSFIE